MALAAMATSAEFLVGDPLKCWVPWTSTSRPSNRLDAQSLHSSTLSAGAYSVRRDGGGTWFGQRTTRLSIIVWPPSCRFSRSTYRPRR